MEAPVYLYYQLTNFYQNHRRYAKSYLVDQMLGTVYQSGSSALDECEPLTNNGSLILNPCGLIANTLFNDKITLATSSGTDGHPKLDTTGIAWPSDKQHKFAQPVQYCKKGSSSSTTCSDPKVSGHDVVGTPPRPPASLSPLLCSRRHAHVRTLLPACPDQPPPLSCALQTGTDYEFAKVSATDSDVSDCLGSTCSDSICSSLGLPDGCKGYHCDDPEYYNCDAGYYAYYYPEDDTQQYLYETFPEVVSPLQGVNNEHFIVWMRTAALPTFRKLYGVIDTDLKKGSSVTIQVEANFDVDGFKGTKSLVLSTVTWFGGKNAFFGVAFLVVGSICLVVGVMLEANLLYNGPRKAGDRMYLD